MTVLFERGWEGLEVPLDESESDSLSKDRYPGKYKDRPFKCLYVCEAL